MNVVMHSVPNQTQKALLFDTPRADILRITATAECNGAGEYRASSVSADLGAHFKGNHLFQHILLDIREVKDLDLCEMLMNVARKGCVPDGSCSIICSPEVQRSLDARLTKTQIRRILPSDFGFSADPAAVLRRVLALAPSDKTPSFDELTAATNRPEENSPSVATILQSPVFTSKVSGSDFVIALTPEGVRLDNSSPAALAISEQLPELLRTAQRASGTDKPSIIFDLREGISISQLAVINIFGTTARQLGHCRVILTPDQEYVGRLLRSAHLHQSVEIVSHP